MIILSIIFIITVFLVIGFNSYCFIMAIKYRNLKNLYKIKNRINYINTSFDLIIKSDEIKKYPQISILLNDLIKNINKLSDIKSIYSFKISNKNNFLEQNSLNNKEIEEEFKLLKENKDIEIINILIQIIQFDYLIFKLKSPLKYLFNIYIKKILMLKILEFIIKILKKFEIFVEKFEIKNKPAEDFSMFKDQFKIIRKY